jgi:hypothetical protein
MKTYFPSKERTANNKEAGISGGHHLHDLTIGEAGLMPKQWVDPTAMPTMTYGQGLKFY